MAPKPEDQTKYGSLPRYKDFDHLEVAEETEKVHSSWNSLRKGVAICTPLLVLAIVVGQKTLRAPHCAQEKSEIPSSHRVKRESIPPLSSESPEDMGFPATKRWGDTLPGKVWGSSLTEKDAGYSKPLPTNAWYLNLLSATAGKRSTESNRVYTVPYILDTVGPLTGLRVHWPVLQASNTNMQMVYDAANGLTLGTLDSRIDKDYVLENEELSHLGLSLKWGDDNLGMRTHIVRGMPYATMEYLEVAPSLVAGNAPAKPPLLDGKHSLECGDILGSGKFSRSKQMTVLHEIQLQFKNSDFTWAVFFSRPVKVQCSVAPKAGPGVISDVMFQLNVVELDNTEPLFVRTALVDQCTTGKSDIAQHCSEKSQMENKAGYLELLRKNAHLFPKTPSVNFHLTLPKPANESRITFDWDVHSVEEPSDGQREVEASDHRKSDLLMFAMPHHQLTMDSETKVTDYCVSSFHGRTCLVSGSQWSLVEKAGEPQSFLAKRPPEPSLIPALAKALANDILTKPSQNLFRGAADTYFSGKFLARLARILLIASELKELSTGDGMESYDCDPETYAVAVEAAKSVNLPSDEDIESALGNLKDAVEVWLTGEAEATYVYDETWGGLINCGCVYVGKGSMGVCNNTFPDCPALVDVNVDFGNGYYNDHHFHYGYHTYAAAVVAKFEPEWGKKFFDRVNLYIRDIANPSSTDSYFPQFRQKDWFLGSSWASGIVSANTPHGRNQESSSEAIAAYEAVALYGKVMMDAYRNENDNENLDRARLIRDAGELLTATEVKAANRYWHVWNSSTHVNAYPPQYTQPVVGMLYETMASFQTWFAPEAFVSYGIQLLPLTPVAEARDDPEWASILYPMYKESCEGEHDFCIKNGWSVAQVGLLATIGEREKALEMALEIPEKVFLTEGGEGHSLTNTIWFVATRPEVHLSQKLDANETESVVGDKTTTTTEKTPAE